MDFGSKMMDLKKKKNFHLALVKIIDVFRKMIGRYDRNEVTSSIDVAKVIADALEVSLDFLAGDARLASADKKTLRLINVFEELQPSIKDKLFFLANAVIRDAKIQRTYAH